MRVRICGLLFSLVLLLCSTPLHASLGVAPQCVAPFQDASTNAADTKTPLPDLAPVRLAYEPEDRDYLIRTIVFEAGEESDEGKAAVAHVVLNRARSGRWGDSIRKVVTRPWQFEPWMTKRKQMAALSSSDPRYRDAARIVDAVLSGQIPDPTAGATHFLNPVVVRKRRGGDLPNWARGEGQPIGRHTFYAPNGGVPTVEQIAMPADGLEISLSCSGQEAEQTPDASLMTLADRG